MKELKKKIKEGKNSWCVEGQLQQRNVRSLERPENYSQTPPVNIQGLDIEIVDAYLGVHINNKLDWSENIGVLYRKGQSRHYLLRRLRSFGGCRTLLRTFYDTIVASTTFYAMVFWGGGIADHCIKS